ncbi:MAG: hypothetical protein GX755_03975 [Syntrophomonadaceae bacterium]|nr:hypothetical protein [Syntrophomonadaceae bacterium]
MNRLLLVEQPESSVIFCNQRNTVDKMQSFLNCKGYASQVLHGETAEDDQD